MFNTIFDHILLRMYVCFQAPSDLATAALQSQIEREQKIQDGAARLLQASKNTTQCLEASKGLFVSKAKILALMREMQQIQTVSTAQLESW